MDILNSKYSYTTKFILPLLFKDRATYNTLFTEPFINSYIADMSNGENDDKIHLLFADYPSLTFQKLLPESVSEYRRGEDFVLVYELPTEYIEDYQKFLVGDYSKFSDKAKSQINYFWQGTAKTSLQYGVLYKVKDKLSQFYNKLLGNDSYHFDPLGEWWAPPKIEQEIMGLVE
jgi:hypothetical protein